MLETKTVTNGSTALCLKRIYFFAAAFLLAAQRAFINCDSFLLPAGVSPPFFLAGLETVW